jgi:hypothetical protein
MGLSANATRFTSLLFCNFALCLLDVSFDRLLEACDDFFSVSSPLLISFDGSISPRVANR